MIIAGLFLFVGLLPGCMCVAHAQLGGHGPGACLLPTPFCAYKINSKGVPVPDADCIGAPTSYGFINGPPSPNPQTQGSLNDGPHCGVSKTTLRVCGDYTAKAAGCTGDVSTCTTPECLCGLNPDDPSCGGDGDGDTNPCDWTGACAYGGTVPQQVPPQHGSPAGAAAELRRVGGQDLPPAIAVLVHQLASFKSVHLKARVLIAEAPVPPSNGGATSFTDYEYWESGGRYRIHTFLDPKLGFQEVTDIAFDRLHHQLLMRDGQGQRLTLTPHDDRSVLLPIGNPLFLPLAFLSPQDPDKCVFCELRLADFSLLRSELIGRENQRTGPSVPSALPPVGAKSFEFGGGVGFDKRTRYVAEFDDSGRVTNIRWTTEAGSALADLQFYDYRTAPGTQFAYPRAIQVAKSLDQAKEPWITFRYVIDLLEFDRPIDDSVFTIPSDSVETIVDWRGRFLKYQHTDKKDFCGFPKP